MEMWLRQPSCAFSCATWQYFKVALGLYVWSGFGKMNILLIYKYTQ